MAITGAHVLIYSPDADAVRGVFRDVFGWKHIDAGEGWLIFGLPPAELAVHPSEGSTEHELSLMCDDIEATVAELRAKGIEFEGEPRDVGHSIMCTMVLPGGVRMLLHQPLHPTVH
jgi:hypothetical protein